MEESDDRKVEGARTAQQQELAEYSDEKEQLLQRRLARLEEALGLKPLT